jgi:hypothetical protein
MNKEVPMGKTKTVAPKTYVTVGMAEDELRKVRKALTVIIKKLEAEDRRKLLTLADDRRRWKACPAVDGFCDVPVWNMRVKTVSGKTVSERIALVLPCLIKLLNRLEHK